MPKRRLLFGLFLIGGLLFAVGFLTLRKVPHTYERMMFQAVADHVAGGTDNPQQAAVQLLEYVHTRMLQPPGDREISGWDPLTLLVYGRGWCDQQATLYIQLLRTQSIQGRLVYLRDGSGASPHSVAEVYLNDAWRVVDPLLGIPLKNSEGELATRQDILNDPAVLASLPDSPTAKKLASQAMYSGEPIVVNTWTGKRVKWMDRVPKFMRRPVFCALQDYYLLFFGAPMSLGWEERLLRRARHYALLRRFDASTRIYKRLIEKSPRLAIRHEARYYLGRNFYNAGFQEEAVKVLQDVLLVAPGYLAPYIHRTLGEIYESLGESAPALRAYRQGDVNDALLLRKMNALPVGRLTQPENQ